MSEIGVEITGAREVELKFATFPTRAHDRLLERIVGLTHTLAARIRGQVPKGQTHKLEGDIKVQIFDDQTSVAGRVSMDDDFAKAGALEYGAHRTTKVREHRSELDHFWSQKLNRPMQVMVSAYTRQPNILERRFLRGPIAAMENEIVEQLRAAVEETIEADA